MTAEPWAQNFNVDRKVLAAQNGHKDEDEWPKSLDTAKELNAEGQRAGADAVDLKEKLKALQEDVFIKEKKRFHRIDQRVKRELAAEDLARLRSSEGQAELAAEFAKDVLTAAKLDDIDPKKPVIENYLDQDSLVRLFGKPKSKKSFIALDMAGCIGAGIKWHGNATTKGRVLYVVAEGLRGVRSRARAWEAQHGRPMEGVDFYPKAVQIGDEEDLRRLIAYTKVHGCLLVIFDTQARCTVGVDENGNTEMGRIVNKLDVLREETGACVMLVHHSGVEGGRARGASGVLGALDAEFEVKCDPKDPTHVSLVTRAQKDRVHAEDLELKTVEINGSLALTDAHGSSAPPPVSVTEAQFPYLKALGEFGSIGASPTDLGKAAGKTRQAATKMLAHLEPLGLVQLVKGTSRYTITGAGSHGASVYAEAEKREAEAAKERSQADEVASVAESDQQDTLDVANEDPNEVAHQVAPQPPRQPPRATPAT